MKAAKIALVLGIAVICTIPVMAGPYHRGGHHRRNDRDGVRLAAEIIGLVRTTLEGPRHKVICPRPVVVTPPARRHCPPRRHCRPLPHGRYHRGRR